MCFVGIGERFRPMGARCRGGECVDTRGVQRGSSHSNVGWSTSKFCSSEAS